MRPHGFGLQRLQHLNRLVLHRLGAGERSNQLNIRYRGKPTQDMVHNGNFLGLGVLDLGYLSIITYILQLTREIPSYSHLVGDMDAWLRPVQLLDER